MQIKICGLTTRETIEATVAAGASHVGLNFYPPSPRFVSAEEAGGLADAAGGLAKVGVFVNPEDAFLDANVGPARLDAIQLHGKESPERVAEVKARFGLPVWKVLSVETAADIARAADYGEVADFLLFDTKTPEGSLPGGMGMGFDWSLLKAYEGNLPWGLAGGLEPDNVAEAIRQTRPALVDVSSGVESAPGVKDVGKIAAFCKAALSA